jgi:hypothetical protein
MAVPKTLAGIPSSIELKNTPPDVCDKIPHALFAVFEMYP